MYLLIVLNFYFKFVIKLNYTLHTILATAGFCSKCRYIWNIHDFCFIFTLLFTTNKGPSSKTFWVFEKLKAEALLPCTRAPWQIFWRIISPPTHISVSFLLVIWASNLSVSVGFANFKITAMQTSDVDIKQPWLTSDVIFSTVQHVGSMDELVTWTSNSQLCLGVAQNYFTPENPGRSVDT